MPLSCPVRRSPFASRSLAEHLARGALAVALATAAYNCGSRSILIVSAALAGIVLLLRGCPTCWLVGLFGTLADRAERAERAERTAPGAAHGSDLPAGRRGSAIPAE